jgi:hypothetical protein
MNSELPERARVLSRSASLRSCGTKLSEDSDAQLVFVILLCAGKDVIRKRRKCALLPQLLLGTNSKFLFFDFIAADAALSADSRIVRIEIIVTERANYDGTTGSS